MEHNDTIDQLNHLVQVNKEAEAGLLAAADSIKNSELESLFKGYAKQHAKFQVQLEEEIKRLGGNLAASGTLGGAIRKGWVDLKSTLSGHSAASVLGSCESGEESAEVAYTDAVLAKRSGQTHTLFEKQLEQIKGFRTRLTRLIGETKDGVEFQHNE